MDGPLRNGDVVDGASARTASRNEVTSRGKDTPDVARGCGTFSYPCGDIYDGEFKGDQKEGFGVFLYNNGDAYAGEWHCNQRHGFGMFGKANGQKYEGTWESDVRSGFGAQTLAQSYRFVGHFSRNLRHGRGVLFQPNGKLYSGVWNYGDTVERHLLFQQPNNHRCFPISQSQESQSGKMYTSRNSSACQGRGEDDQSRPRIRSEGPALPKPSVRTLPLIAEDDGVASSHQNADDGTAQSVTQPTIAHRMVTAKLRSSSSSTGTRTNSKSLIEAQGLTGSLSSSSSPNLVATSEQADIARSTTIPRGQQPRGPDAAVEVPAEPYSAGSDAPSSGVDDSQHFVKQFKRVQINSSAETCLQWSRWEIGHFVRMLGFKRVSHMFIESGIDGCSLPGILSEPDVNLKNIGLVEPAVRRVATIAFEILLKLHYKCTRRKAAGLRNLELARHIHHYTIDPQDILLGDLIGVGSYGEVYKGLLLRSPPKYHPHRPPLRDSKRRPKTSQCRNCDCNRRTSSRESLGSYSSASSASHSSSLSSLTSNSDADPTPVENDHHPPTLFSSRKATMNGRRHFRQLEHINDEMLHVAANHVAIKMFPSLNSNSGELQASNVTSAHNFYSELSIVTRLSHRNVPRFIGILKSPAYSIVTEYLPCGSLFDILHRHKIPLSTAQVLKFSRELCAGMCYLHALGILHCDLKSSNILLSHKGDVKICDFGLATQTSDAFRSEEHYEMRPGMGTDGVMLGCIGTFHWMAPEVLRGGGFTKAADVYSFGMMVWEMLSRKVPYEGMPLTHIRALVGYGCRSYRTETLDADGAVETVDNASYNWPLTGSLLDEIGADPPLALRRLLRACLQPLPRNRPTFAQLVDVLGTLYNSAVVDVEESLRDFFGQG